MLDYKTSLSRCLCGVVSSATRDPRAMVVRIMVLRKACSSLLSLAKHICLVDNVVETPNRLALVTKTMKRPLTFYLEA